MSSLFQKIALYFNPPKPGDVFSGDAFILARNSHFERRCYKTLDGNEWAFMPGETTYRLVVESSAMPYYICSAEVLAYNTDDHKQLNWLKRSSPRRIWKRDFHKLILEGQINKE